MGEGRHLREFPEHLRLVGEQVARVSFWHALFAGDEEAFIGERWSSTDEGFEVLYDCYDFCVEMKDGRDFVFTACTPEWVRQYLQREGAKSFVDSGLVLVSEVSIDAMLDALEKCLEMADSYGLEHFGLLAPPSVDDEDAQDKQATFLPPMS